MLCASLLLRSIHQCLILIGLASRKKLLSGQLVLVGLACGHLAPDRVLLKQASIRGSHEQDALAIEVLGRNASLPNILLHRWIVLFILLLFE